MELNWINELINQPWLAFGLAWLTVKLIGNIFNNISYMISKTPRVIIVKNGDLRKQLYKYWSNRKDVTRDYLVK